MTYVRSLLPDNILDLDYEEALESIETLKEKVRHEYLSDRSNATLSSIRPPFEQGSVVDSQRDDLKLRNDISAEKISTITPDIESEDNILPIFKKRRISRGYLNYGSLRRTSGLQLKIEDISSDDDD